MGTQPASNPLALIRAMAKALAYHDPDSETTRQLVYASSDIQGIDDELARRVIELGNGRSVGDVIAIIYSEEIRAGAWAVDIGIWSDIFAQSVLGIINDLADTGYILLKGADAR